MKRALLIPALFFFFVLSGFSQKKLSYEPRPIENPEEVLERLISKDPRQGNSIGDIKITKFRLSILSKRFSFHRAMTTMNPDKLELENVLLGEITKLQIIHEEKNLYILEVFDSRRKKKQLIIYSNYLEDLQKCYDAFYTLNQRAKIEN